MLLKLQHQNYDVVWWAGAGVVLSVVVYALFFLAWCGFMSSSIFSCIISWWKCAKAGTCEEEPFEFFTWCTLESSRGTKNGIYSCTGLLYFHSGIWFHSWQDWERAPLDIRLCHYPTWAITGCRSIWITLNYFHSNFFHFSLFTKYAVDIKPQHTTQYKIAQQNTPPPVPAFSIMLGKYHHNITLKGTVAIFIMDVRNLLDQYLLYWDCE